MAGRFRHRVEIQRRVTTVDAVGQVNDTWNTTACVWVQILPVTSKEYLAQGPERSELTHTIRLRHGPDILPKDRIRFGSRIFDVMGVMNVSERNRFIEIRAREDNNG